mmetsp:Transcript_94987/g.245369  ORF Transcript_94987/g.245369 Transcript_94987/m.245369 type:complete len:739 (+) Transcript_94987:128-2344(+)|eukprot:CAMPEP_0195116868 /NCGR_PEP_ID=MMETSP0448-20130528/113017_1 /TAXON_ID=66468 /ORGANISM="Heterocapsa triquestra, Strain CCMP 448" /LENGTH=738 /DNA_ID=CAMNT_0040154059 /DNA_START=33 /DNA_END=2249 /DNA_ORIENTATION=+
MKRAVVPDPVGLTTLRSLPEEVPCEDDANSDVADGGSSHVGSNINSVVSSAKRSSRFGSIGHWSALTAPPRYRNSGSFVHGTKFRHFHSIMAQGLKAAKTEIFMIDEVRIDGRVPGLGAAPEILIFIDENKARSENMSFEYDSSHGTWKTKGLDGVIRPWFFQKVVDQRKGPSRGNVLFQSKEDPLMQANQIKGNDRPQYLIHATFWENVFGIMKEGIVPAKNPTSELRSPFKGLLQGAESHIYTVASAGASASVMPCRRYSEDFNTGMVRPKRHSEDNIVVRPRQEPEAVPEREEEEEEATLEFTLQKEQLGLERQPDAFFVIDTEKAQKLGIKLEMVQSGDREDTIFVQGSVPPELLAQAEANDPVNLPEALKAKIVDPRSFNDIPIIDLRLPEAKIIEQMRYACEVVGFMQVVGHGISEQLQERHMELQKRFFAMSEEVKQRLILNDEFPVRGYFGKGGEDLDQVLQEQVDSAGGKEVANKKRMDNKEALDTNGVPWSKPVGGAVAHMFGQHTRIPEEEELPGFREVLEEYASEMFRLSKKLLTIIALILGKPRDFFEQFLTNPVATHRLLHYWPLKDFEKQIGVGEHTDYGLLTVLKQDAVGGLQVLNAKDGRWVHACPINNAFVVNLGDMLSRWTAHRFKSTVHRVVNVSLNERYSVPFFLEPNMDAVIVEGGICEGPSLKMEGLSKHDRRCRLRKLWRQVREQSGPTAEEILERFYIASGQLKPTRRGFSTK